MLLNNCCINNEVKEEIKKFSGNKWKWIPNSPEPVGHNEGSPEREVHSSMEATVLEQQLNKK